MGRSARRSTHWEGATTDISLSTASINGEELIPAVMVNAIAPATLVRIRGFIACEWNTSPTIGSTNRVTMVTLAIRKVTLVQTTSAYAVPAGSLRDEGYMSAEDILWMGAVKLWGASTTINSVDSLAVLQRATGFVDIDIKAMRKFDSAEERLVLEAELLFGQVTPNINVNATLRMLFKAG